MTTNHEEWRGVGVDINFKPEDFEILDLTIGLIPELRICAEIVKRARSSNVRYPIVSPEQLADVALAGNTHFKGGGHRFDRDDILAYVPSEHFPIGHEGELISRTYIALCRCREEFELAQRLHPNTLRRLHAESEMGATNGPRS